MNNLLKKENIKQIISNSTNDFNLKSPNLGKNKNNSYEKEIELLKEKIYLIEKKYLDEQNKNIE